jgi:predicted deacylase
MAESFAAPVILHSATRDGSLREIASNHNIQVLLYEAGEALRFDEIAIRAGVSGIINVMRHIGMLPASRSKKPKRTSMITGQSSWIRATSSGVLRALVPLGEFVTKGDVLALISDPMGNNNADTKILANDDGIVIGRTFLPLVYEGDALFHVAKYKANIGEALEHVTAFREEFEPEPYSTSDDTEDHPPIAG